MSYQVSAINGGGYKNSSRSTNTIDLEGRVSVNPIKKIMLAAGGYTGKLGKSNDTVNVEHQADALQCARGLHRQAKSGRASNISAPRTGTISHSSGAC